MILYQEKKLKIYFGDTQSCYVKSNNSNYINNCRQLIKQLNLSRLIVLKQTHGINGLCITQENVPDLGVTVFKGEGDFLITDQMNLANCFNQMF